MGKHLNPLEKEFLIQRFRSSPGTSVREFCDAVDISEASFRKWLKQYESQGIEGFARADTTVEDILPAGIDRTEENYKREILKLRIENERLKKNYTVKTLENGEQVYVHLRPKTTK